MNQKKSKTSKQLVISKKNENPKYLMAEGEYTNIIVGANQTGNEYVITDGNLKPNSFVPDHYHKWEDQTFHIVEGEIRAKIGNKWYDLGAGDAIHCPRGISHYIKNTGSTTVRIISYIFPGDWAEEFFAETSRQNHTGEHNPKFIEDKFGVVYL